MEPQKEAPIPYRREEMTLAQIKANQRFTKGWMIKQTDHEGSFVLPLRLFFHNISEHDPRMQCERTAFFNELETVVLLVQVGYTDRPVITLLNQSRAIHYLASEVK